MEYPPSIIAVGLNPAIDRTVVVPGLSLGETVTATSEHRFPAGKAVNVARVLADHDLKSLAMGFVGEASHRWFTSELTRLSHGLADHCFTKVLGVVRENLTLIDPEREMETHIKQPGRTIENGDWREVAEEIVTVSSGGDWVLFCGSLPLGLDTDQFCELLKDLKTIHCFVVVDTSGDGLVAASEVGVDLIKPNLSELTAASGLPVSFDPQAPDVSSILAALDRLNRTHGESLVSLGADGVVLVNHALGECLWARDAVPPPKIMSTVGCGDTLLASWLACRYQGKSVNEALRHAVAAATVNAMQPGIAGLDLALVEQRKADVKLRKLEIP